MATRTVYEYMGEEYDTAEAVNDAILADIDPCDLLDVAQDIFTEDRIIHLMFRAADNDREIAYEELLDEYVSRQWGDVGEWTEEEEDDDEDYEENSIIDPECGFDPYLGCYSDDC